MTEEWKEEWRLEEWIEEWTEEWRSEEWTEEWRSGPNWANGTDTLAQKALNRETLNALGLRISP